MSSGFVELGRGSGGFVLPVVLGRSGAEASSLPEPAGGDAADPDGDGRAETELEGAPLPTATVDVVVSTLARGRALALGLPACPSVAGGLSSIVITP